MIDEYREPALVQEIERLCKGRVVMSAAYVYAFDADECTIAYVRRNQAETDADRIAALRALLAALKVLDDSGRVGLAKVT